MSLRKNISGGQLIVPFLDLVLEDGETAEFPDVQADGVSPIVWPDDKTEAVAEPKPAKAAAKADDTSGKADG